MRTRSTILRGLAALVVLSSMAPVAQAGEPGLPASPAVYGVHATHNVMVRMRDGVRLAVDVKRPSDPATGEPAAGTFPVLLTQTPYGKSGSAGTYFVQRGYIALIADIRGKGYSEGVWDFFSPQEIGDGVDLVTYAAGRPNAFGEPGLNGSNGTVGLFGASYLGINQLLTAGRVGPGSPLKAIAPVVAANDLYRDQVFYGGVPNQQFGPAYAVTSSADSLGDPLSEGGTDDPAYLANVEFQRSGVIGEAIVTNQEQFAFGEERAYDGPFWKARSPVSHLAAIVANDISVLSVGAWYDLFLRGEPLSYTGLQNAAAGRPVLAQMLPGQPVDPRFQLLIGPWYHSAGAGLDLDRIQLEWFDTWLKGRTTTFNDAAGTVHIYELGAGRWVETDGWPLPGTTAQRWYLSGGPSASGALSMNDGLLSLDRPTAPGGADIVVYTGVGNPCQRQTFIQGAGLGANYTRGLVSAEPCEDDERLLGVGPGALTYTTPPFGEDRTLAGPISASITITSTTVDAYLVASVEDVAPDGTATPLTAGALLGRFRAIDEGGTWRDPSGTMLRPYHPFTRESVQMLTPGEPTTLDIEVSPIFARIAKDHRVRITLTTTSWPQVEPAGYQVPDLVGGVYGVQRNASGASHVDLPFVDPAAAGGTCGICATRPPG
jgi:hypothetical protein